MSRERILLIGAYGQFGSRIAEALARDDVDLLLAGRDLARAQALADRVGAAGGARLIPTRLDVESPHLVDDIAALAPTLLIHTAGPFQRRDYRVADAAIAVGAHYIDLADGREFVTGIDRLDAQARARGVRLVSGASSVPGLSAAVVAAHAPRFARLESVESAISPGNRTERGLATTRAILGYVGRPFPALVDGQRRAVHGWQSLRRLRFDDAGTRWLARCDVPDLDVLPHRYPDLRHCDFRAGLELRRMHFGLWLVSWAVRARIVRGLERHATALLKLSNRWIDAGSDTGVMAVDLVGTSPDGKPLRLRWTIVARDGSGPHIPATAAVVLARCWRHASPPPGAGACVDLFDLHEFMAALDHLPIAASTQVLVNG
ncbi:saccharopine dehydrogenase [Lysobacter sp. TY2-98]|uniref:saccharopine dehydrogenase family protein n=1 Tax=Lysobacter sp. TY2-98 TaxID=2290922 RepID=UPI000E20C384|nr:saccharopine dehydrogenase NADP-binding domain-containing protein [Lysobacter sp. TY2-98]AXK71003.1 saccharopine dehydrogenase [Lysobacter sp. TY2-98]